jgi:acyl-CoA dehydrogenase
VDFERTDDHVERLWRDVRLFRLAPVSQEMILIFIGQHVLDLPRTY